MSLQHGFTLPELLAASFLVFLLLGAGVLFAHPHDYGPASRNGERWVAVSQIANLVGKYVHDNGRLPDGVTKEPQAIGSEVLMYDLCPALSPAYTKAMPIDPTDGTTETKADCADTKVPYISGYTIQKTSDRGIVVAAPLAEDKEEIKLSVDFDR